MKRQTGAGQQARHRVNNREPEGYRRGMRRCALVWLLASALAAVGTPDASARHKHLSQHRKKAVEVEQHKHRIDSAVESTTPLPPDVAAAKQAIELVRRHKSKDATALAASSGDPVVKKLMERRTLSKEAPDQIVSGQEEMPLDAFGYLGGLFEARFYEPHSTTGNPRDEIQQAASLYGLDLAMMMPIAKVESSFDPRARTGSYKGLFQLSDYEFEKYGDGSIWDARDNARAAAHMFLVQAEKFKWALGHYPDYAERYVVHQQGIQGAIEHYTHPERVAWQSMCATDEGALKGEQWCRKCIWRNLLPQWKRTFRSVEKISSGDFVTLWTGRINHLANRFSVPEGDVSPSPHPSRVSGGMMR